MEFFVSPRRVALEEMPRGIEGEVLLCELTSIFYGDARSGRSLGDVTPAALRLLADGYSPSTARWLLRESAVRACVSAFDEGRQCVGQRLS